MLHIILHEDYDTTTTGKALMPSDVSLGCYRSDVYHLMILTHVCVSDQFDNRACMALNVNLYSNKFYMS